MLHSSWLLNHAISVTKLAKCSTIPLMAMSLGRRTPPIRYLSTVIRSETMRIHDHIWRYSESLNGVFLIDNEPKTPFAHAVREFVPNFRAPTLAEEHLY